MYQDFYGFREAPFNITPDPRFLFFSDQHREAFNHILFGIRERKGFIQVTGEVGAGKTTVCRAILEAEDSLARCQEAVDDPAVATDPRALQERLAALNDAQAEVERLYARWAELEAKVR